MCARWRRRPDASRGRPWTVAVADFKLSAYPVYLLAAVDADVAILDFLPPVVKLSTMLEGATARCGTESQRKIGFWAETQIGPSVFFFNISLIVPFDVKSETEQKLTPSLLF